MNFAAHHLLIMATELFRLCEFSLEGRTEPSLRRLRFLWPLTAGITGSNSAGRTAVGVVCCAVKNKGRNHDNKDKATNTH
jgi:hypothetical protein